MSDTVARPFVTLSNERALFCVYNEDGEQTAAHTVKLRKLIEDKDEVGLLLWGLLTQMASLNLQIAEAQARPPQTPDIGKIMESAMGPAMEMAMKMNSGAGAAVSRPTED